MKKYSLLFTLLFLLFACQKETQEPQTFATLPEISYDEHTLNEFKQQIQAGATNHYEGLRINSTPILSPPKNLPSSLFYQSGIEITYPEDGVRGIFVPIEILQNQQEFLEIIQLINETELNAIVIDIKDDHGYITTQFDTTNQEILNNTLNSIDITYIMNVLQENQIYPIARIVTFKDTIRAENHPDLSFISKETGELWDDRGAKFINPFIKSNQDYVIDVAIEAAKVGFKDIQLDYIRFPEGFETFHDTLNYSVEEFSVYNNSGEERTAVIADFIAKTKSALQRYNVNLSADIFGYIAIVKNTEEVTGIGQDFYKIAENVDVISAMPYPSHWSEGFFGIDYPNANPYDTITEYIWHEKEALTVVTNTPISRPWIQGFTDYDKIGLNFIEYTSYEIQQQINALFENGMTEYLIWNPNGIYYHDVDYKPN